MRIGDKVRLLKGTEEGFIVSIKGNIVEIEIEDGLTIPAVKNEVVVVDQKESEAFNIPETEENSENPNQQRSIAEGIYLGLDDAEPMNCFLINQTPDKILFSISTAEKKHVYGFASGLCESYDSIEIGQIAFQGKIADLDFIIQVMVHQPKSKVKHPPIEANLIIQRADLKEKVFVRALDKRIALFNIENTPARAINPEEIKEHMVGGKSTDINKNDTFNRSKDQIIDLHIDPSSINLPENEILGYQLKLFEKSYDQAILTNASSLKVIHGIGSGKLRRAIHKIISQRKEVKYFEDGDKEKFGFGSTLIHF